MKVMKVISMTALLVVLMTSFGNRAAAQFTFMGDYDKTFAAPKGYYLDPQGANGVGSTYASGGVMSDGSIVAGGTIERQVGVNTHHFYLRKFTASGAPVENTAPFRSFTNPAGTIVPDAVIQPDGKILIVGYTAGRFGKYEGFLLRSDAFVFNQFGQSGDRPVPGDYDNDGKNDLAIFRSGVWYGLRSGDNSVFGVAYGASTDVPVPAAYLP